MVEARELDSAKVEVEPGPETRCTESGALSESAGAANGDVGEFSGVGRCTNSGPLPLRIKDILPPYQHYSEGELGL